MIVVINKALRHPSSKSYKGLLQRGREPSIRTAPCYLIDCIARATAPKTPDLFARPGFTIYEFISLVISSF
jgi:hypothetical protein